MRIQITLSSPASKKIIAKGIKANSLVQQVRRKGKIILKGGTTISAVCEELSGKPMKISGMITPKGTLTSHFQDEIIEFAHGLVLIGDEIIPLDTKEAWERETPTFTPQDLVITGANAFDAYGHAVIMAGSYTGGKALPFFQTMLIEGIPFLIAAGLEKLVPGNLWDVISFAGRKKVDFSYGMSVGLVPVFGKIFTEVQALETLVNVKAVVIGKGGIHGAEGSSTLLIEGAKKEVLKIDEIYQEVKGASLSGVPRNLIPCSRGNLFCKEHLGCLYKRGQRE
jgi:hypothetical protein